MKLILKVCEVKRFKGLEVHHDGIKPTNFPEAAECSSLREIEASIDSMVELKERLETPSYYILK